MSEDGGGILLKHYLIAGGSVGLDRLDSGRLLVPDVRTVAQSLHLDGRLINPCFYQFDLCAPCAIASNGPKPI